MTIEEKNTIFVQYYMSLNYFIQIRRLQLNKYFTTYRHILKGLPID
jgi:hypothetical protein